VTSTEKEKVFRSGEIPSGAAGRRTYVGGGGGNMEGQKPKKNTILPTSCRLPDEENEKLALGKKKEGTSESSHVLEGRGRSREKTEGRNVRGGGTIQYKRKGRGPPECKAQVFHDRSGPAVQEDKSGDSNKRVRGCVCSQE